MYAAEIKNLRKEYKKVTAVKDVSFTINDGEIISLLGMNGAGKTTVIKMLSCLTKPTSGEAFIYGKSILTDPTGVKQLIGISPQENSAATKLTVEENLRFMCGIYGIDKAKTDENVEKIIKQFSLEEYRDRLAGKLSGGWQKRLSIAMALITEPKILFLDEPTLGLDVMARRELWKIIENLKGKMTIIVTTHYLEESEHLADRIVIMKEGNIKALGTLEELKQLTGEEKLEEIFLKISAEEVM
ncbi:MAG: ATP-binding cassette domain-containing protein [Ruminiclostridium sp.]|nr:ATP-binding cassette domain-containing protein [Ruminiclostridium sp.]